MSDDVWHSLLDFVGGTEKAIGSTDERAPLLDGVGLLQRQTDAHRTLNTTASIGDRNQTHRMRAVGRIGCDAVRRAEHFVGQLRNGAGSGSLQQCIDTQAWSIIHITTIGIDNGTNQNLNVLTKKYFRSNSVNLKKKKKKKKLTPAKMPGLPNAKSSPL
jgi:hypothetical protein